MVTQALYFGDTLPNNYDKINQVWLKTGKSEVSNQTPDEFKFDIGHYKTTT